MQYTAVNKQNIMFDCVKGHCNVKSQEFNLDNCVFSLSFNGSIC